MTLLGRSFSSGACYRALLLASMLGLASLLALGRPARIFAGDGDGGAPQERILQPVVGKSPPAPGWGTAEDMKVARAALAVAVTDSGFIYAIGGQDVTGKATKAVEVYNPSTGKWSDAPPLNDARRMAAAAVGKDGYVYVIGGDDGGNFSEQYASYERYNPALPNATWELSTDSQALQHGRRNFAAVTGPDGRIYAIGGYNRIDLHFDSVEIRDPMSGTWTQVDSWRLPQALSRLGAAIDEQGRVYIVGGQGKACPLPTSSCGETEVMRFNPDSNMWEDVPNAQLGTGIEQLVAAFSGGVLYAIGGVTFTCNADLGCTCNMQSQAGCHQSSMGAFVPGQASWTSLGTVPGALSLAGKAMGKDGRIYIIGGTDGSEVYPTVQVFDPSMAP